VVTESAAIAAYVADVLPGAGLAPPVDAPERGAYATWMAFCPGALEPAFTDTIFPRQTQPPASSIGWPPFPEALGQVERALAKGPYLLGARFSAADVMIGALLHWLHGWGKLPPSPAVERYLETLAGRAALQRAQRLNEAAPAGRTMS
jgi:glutathione S-transferase